MSTFSPSSLNNAIVLQHGAITTSNAIKWIIINSISHTEKDM